jgi:hypothetical protein
MRNVSEAFMQIFNVTTLVLGICVSNAAFAANTPDPAIAIFKHLSGKVLVNSGDGFVAASPALRMKAGDTIMIGPNASADLYFPEAKCMATLAKATVATITGPEMCQQALGPDAAGSPVITPANSGVPPQGEIPPLFIASGIVLLSTAALIQSFSEKNTPVTAP